MTTLQEALKKAGLAEAHGGVNQLRGDEFERRALIFFLLGRLIDHPNLEVHVQGPTDALLVIERGRERITELIECKKIEARAGAASSGDAYLPGRVTPSTLKDWKIDEILKRLEGESGLYYTLLTFGTLSEALSTLTPVALRNERVPITVGRRPLEGFSADYSHPASVVAGIPRVRGQDKAWRRVRMVPLEEPARLRLISRGILEQPPFDVSTGLSARVYDQIEQLIAKRRTLTVPNRRWLSSAEISELIKAGRQVGGRWQRPAEPDGPNLEPDRAARIWAALEYGGFVVVCGPPGQGKTRLCLEVARLARDAWRGDPSADVRYLAVHHGTELGEERRFLEDKLNERHLFIIDDEHRSHDEAEQVVQAYVDRWRVAQPRARLLVTSATTYHPSQSGLSMSGRRGASLNLAENEILRSRETLEHLLTGLERAGKLQSGISPTTLADLAGGNLKLALLCDRAAVGLGPQLPVGRWRNKPQLVTSLERWLLDHLGRALGADDVKQRIRPFFVLGAYDIAIPRSWSGDVPTLERYGFLKAIDEEFAADEMVRVTDPALAGLLAAHTPEEDRLEILCQHVDRYPLHLAELFAGLSGRSGSLEGGRKLAAAIVNRKRATIVAILNDRLEPLRVGEVAQILGACGHSSARDLLRHLLQGQRPDQGFFDRLIQIHTCSLDGLAALLNVARYIDGDRTARAAAGLAQRRQATLRELFRSPAQQLHAVAACLRALRRCDPNPALRLFRKWQAEDLDERIRGIGDASERLMKVLRYCDEIRWVDRRAALATLERYAPVEVVVEALARWQRLDRVLQFFALLQRLHRRLAHRCLMRFNADEGARIEAALRAEPNLLALKTELYYLSRFDRRLARGLSRKTWSHIRRLISEERDFHVIGSVIQSIADCLGDAEARRWAKEVDRTALLEGMRDERRSVNLVGEMLFSVGRVDQQLGEWLAPRLDWKNYLPRIRRWIFPNLGYLLRGFLVASHPAERSSLVDAIVASRPLLDLVDRGWKTTPALREVVLLPALLVDGGMPRDAIGKLLEPINSATGFEGEILQRLGESNDCSEIAQSLYVIARYDPVLARRGLEAYVSRVRRAREAGRHDTPFLPEQTPDLVGLGQMLTIAAAVDPTLAAELSSNLETALLAERADREDDLGRLQQLVSGLGDANYRKALGFLDAFEQPDAWERKVSVTQNFRSTIQFIRAVMLASKSRGLRFCRYLVEHMADDIETELEATASLSTIGGWMKSCVLAEVDTAILGRLGRLLDEAAPFEGRLLSYVEAAEAALLANLRPVAKRMAECAVQHNWQVSSIVRLGEWIDLYDRAHRLEAASGLFGLAAQLFAEDKSWHLDALLAAEQDGVAVGLAYRSLSTVGNMPAVTIRSIRDRILKTCDRESDPLRRALGSVLAEASSDAVEQALDQLRNPDLWGLGLLLLAGDAAGWEPAAITPLTRLMGAAVNGAGEPDRDVYSSMESVRFALEVRVRLAVDSSNTRLFGLLEDAQLRAADETRLGVRHLLDPRSPREFWRTSPSALAQIFERSILRSSTLTWLVEIDRSSTQEKFG